MTSSKSDIEVLYEQARRHLQGDGVPCSYELGLPFLKEAADLGHMKAQYNLGILLHQGLSVSQSYEEAYRYFELAAQQGHPRAQYMLGCYFAFGFWLLPSDEHAFHYFRLAAEAGVADLETVMMAAYKPKK